MEKRGMTNRWNDDDGTGKKKMQEKRLAGIEAHAK